MDKKGVAVSDSFIVTAEENIDTLYPMLFGVSCAFFALRLLPEPEIWGDDKWLEIRDRMLKGSVHLFGLFVWRVQRDGCKSGRGELLQKLENAEKQILELKKRRSEEARANEKVVSIFATREQSWFDERKRLRQQIAALLEELRDLEMKKDETISELNERLKESEAVLESKEKSIEEGEQTRWAIEEKFKKAESIVDELKENVKREAQRHSNEILKHKTAFIELVSNQRQLEAEMVRVLRQVEAAKEELDSVSEQKDQSVLMAQRLSMDILKMSKDLEQKDQILSALLRKSKLDEVENQVLPKETKSSKVKRKQSELETARWKAFTESKHERHSLRKVLSKHVNAQSDVFSGGQGVYSKAIKSKDADCEYEFKLPDVRDELEDFKGTNDSQFLSKAEAEAYEIAAAQRGNLEIDVFVDQMRLKDAKLGALRWRLLSNELELNRLQSHVKELDQEVMGLRQEKTNLEALLLDRDTELHALKEQLVLQFNPPNLQKLNFSSSLRKEAVNHDTVWSKVKIIKRKPGQKRQEMKAIAEEFPQAGDVHKEDEIPPKELPTDVQEVEATALHRCHQPEIIKSGDLVRAETSTSSVGHVSTKKIGSAIKMDIHALGISYKIKRLKQHLLMLERLAGKQESCDGSENKNKDSGVKGFNSLIFLLKKHVSRYESLQCRTDDICQRMLENNLHSTCGGSNMARAENETKRLEHFLEETFQLQRYIVATGQKLMEVQAEITSGFVGDAKEAKMADNFDAKRFADSTRTLLQEIQRGLEVRISRIIGDLGGTLARDGIIHLKK